MELDVVRDADGHEAEEDEHQHVAHAEIGQVGGVEEAEHDAEQTDEHHLQTAVPDQGQADEGSETGGQDDGALHGVEGYPALGAGSRGSETGFTVVGSVDIVKEVVDEVGVNLHDECKEETERQRQPAEGD